MAQRNQLPDPADIWAAYGRGSARLFETAPRARISIDDHAALTMSGEPFDEINWAVIDAGADPAGVLAQYVEQMRGAAVDGYIMVSAAARAAVEPAALGLGLSGRPGPPLLVRPGRGSGVMPIVTAAAQIEAVADEWALSDAVDVIQGAFGAPRGTVERAFGPDLLEQAGLDIFLLREDGEQTTAAISTVDDGLVGVWAMGTTPDYQRQGLGRILLEHVLDQHAAHAEWFFLTASPLGRPLYERLGFVELDAGYSYGVDAGSM